MAVSTRHMQAAAWVCAAMLAAPAADAEAPAVVASIKPVHALVAAVMEGVGEPALLIDEAASPHSYALRPSDARALSRADIVVWIGEDLELFLERPLRTLAGGARIVTLMDAGGVARLPGRAGGVWEAEGGGDDEQHADSGGHRGYDTHLWLDPRNAAVMADAVALALIERDPDNADLYRANTERLDARLAALERSLTKRLAPVRGRPFLVFHDAYQYFEQRFGIPALGAITVSPESLPGGARLRALRDRVVMSPVRCIFSEPQFEPRLVRTLLDGTDADSGILDPLGAALPAGPSQYFALMDAMADSLIDCLGGQRSG